MLLKEIEEVCNKCKGTGHWCNHCNSSCMEFFGWGYEPCIGRHIDHYGMVTCKCPICNGTGKTDFYRNLTKKIHSEWEKYEWKH
jgi:hypothetical protein